MNKNVILYRRVYDRENGVKISFHEFISGDLPEEILPSKEIYAVIKSTEDKESRNILKRALLPAASLEDTSILSIDIDGLNERVKMEIINKLAKWEYTYMICESVSGNLVVYVQWDRKLIDHYSQLYYKIWLELTNLLIIPIDFLPEIDRLRYVSLEKIYFNHMAPKIYDSYMDMDVPYITTSKKGIEKAKGGATNFGSH